MLTPIGWNSYCAWYVTGLACAAICVVTFVFAHRLRAYRDWHWFAAFSAMQAACAWLALAASWLPFGTRFSPVIPFLLLLLSLAALAEFGRRAYNAAGFPPLKPAIHMLPVGLASFGVFSGTLAGLRTSCWLAIGLPAAIFTAIGLVRTARGGKTRAAIQASLTAAALIVFVSSFLLKSPTIGALAALVMLAGIWLWVQSHTTSDPRAISLLFGWKGPSMVALLLLLGCFVLAGSDPYDPLTSMAIVEVEIEPSNSHSAWDDEAYQRWKVALPILAVLFVLPAAGAAAYCLRSAH